MISPRTPKSSSTPSSSRAFCSSAAGLTVAFLSAPLGSARRASGGSSKPLFAVDLAGLAHRAAARLGLGRRRRDAGRVDRLGEVLLDERRRRSSSAAGSVRSVQGSSSSPPRRGSTRASSKAPGAQSSAVVAAAARRPGGGPCWRGGGSGGRRGRAPKPAASDARRPPRPRHSPPRSARRDRLRPAPRPRSPRLRSATVRASGRTAGTASSSLAAAAGGQMRPQAWSIRATVAAAMTRPVTSALKPVGVAPMKKAGMRCRRSPSAPPRPVGSGQLCGTGRVDERQRGHQRAGDPGRPRSSA